MLTLALNLDGSNPDNTKTRTYPIRTDVTSDEGGVYVPEHGVFFPDSLVVRHVDSNSELILNRDYYLTYYSKHLVANYGIDGFAGIVLTNKALTGNLEITANHVGGGYVRFNPTYVVEVVNLVSGVPEQLFWDNVIDAPSTAHPNAHKLPAEAVATGYEDYVATLWILVNKVQKLSEVKTADKIPPGTIMETTAVPNFFRGNKYWLYMEGQTITRAEYPELFIALDIANGTDTYTLERRDNRIMRAR